MSTIRHILIPVLAAMLMVSACSKKEAPTGPAGPAELRSGDKAADKAADDRAAADKAAADKAAAEQAAKIAASATAIAAAAAATPAEGAAAPPTAKALLLTKGQHFMFSLEGSAQRLAAVTAKCGAEQGSDSDKMQGCIDKVKAAAANEGFRFEARDDDKWTWISHGRAADGSEEVFIKAVVALQESPADRLVVKVAGEVSGKQWDAMPDKAKAAMKDVSISIIVVDATTVAMDSPKKGRLVYNLRK